ncbi:hypothetical protein [Methanococcus maripaludis]|uniref:Uncharacterized protein n=2 Tax=Methanococcus maripaludis TaxID=39152 RepID=A0A7J9PEH3_METMI|nr:hypothetical protein [Methanococcus maripaludis]MBA2861653.1 hypothetical protein [Methanococcus maripaludis]
MYAEMSKEELLKRFDGYVISKDVKEKTEATKILGYLGIKEIKSRMDEILKLTLENDISIRLNVITAFSNILNKFPEVFSEFLSCIYFTTEFSNNILSEHAKHAIKAFEPDVIERHVEHFKNGIYSKNTEERIKGIVGLSLISRFSPEFLDKALSEIVMVSTYDKSELVQLIALGTLDDFSQLDRNLLRYSHLVFNKKMDTKPVSSVNTNDEISKSLTDLAISEELGENTIIELLKYLSNENDFYSLLAAISLKNNISEVKNAFSKYPLIFNDQISKFYKKHLNNIQELVSCHLILDMCCILDMEPKNVDFEKIFYYLKKNISGKEHLSKAYSLKILYSLFKMKKLDLDEKIDETFDNYPFENILKEHPLCYHFGMPLLIEKYNTLPKVDKNPYLISSLDLKMRYMGPAERYQYLKSTEKNFENEYWLERYESAKKIGTVLYFDEAKDFINFDLLNQILHDEVYLVRNIGIWMLRILSKYDVKIPEKIILEAIHNLKSPYWELRLEYYLFFNELLEKNSEILKNFNIASKLKFSLGNLHVTEEHSPSKAIIKDILNKILDNLENRSENFQNELKIVDYPESYLENPVSSAAFLEKLKIMLDSYILKNDEKNISKVLKFLETYESKVDSSYLIEELVKLKKDYESADHLLNNLKNRYKLIPKSLEIQISNSLNNPIIEHKIDGLEEILVYLKEGFELSEEMSMKIKEILIMYRDEKLTKSCLNILNLQSDLESRRIVLEKEEFDTYLNDLKGIKGLSDEKIKNISPEELYVKLNHILHKKSDYDYESINFNDILYFLSDYSKIPSVILITIILKILKNVIHDPNSDFLNKIDVENSELLDDLYYLTLSTDYSIISKNALLLTVEIVKNKPEWLSKNIAGNSKNRDWIIFLNLFLDYPDDKVVGETLDALDYHAKNSKYYAFSKEFLEKLIVLLDTSSWTNFKKIVKVLSDYSMDKELLNTISKLLIEKIEKSNDDSRLVLLRFFKIQDVSKIDENLINKLFELKKSENYDIKRDIEEIESKII